jgi:hypothetical protein
MPDQVKQPVECQSGYSGCDYPIEILFENQRLKVNQIEKEWREPDGKRYIVKTEQGMRFNLVYFEETNTWQIQQIQRIFRKQKPISSFKEN